MSRPAYFLTLKEGSWQIARIEAGAVELREVGLGEEGMSESKAREIADAFAELGCRGQEVCLGLPSSMILSAEIDSSNLSRRKRRTSMLYRLEEQLPLDAEGLTVDFLSPLAGKSMGLAVVTEKVRALIDTLAEAGVQVVVVSATSFLVLWEFCRDKTQSAGYVVIASASNCDVFRVQDRRPVRWYTLSARPEEVVRCLEAELLQTPVESARASGVILGECDAALVELLNGSLPIEFKQQSVPPPLELAARASARALNGEPAGWVNFRQGPLAIPNPWSRVEGLLKSAAVLGLAFLLAITSVFYLRGESYAKSAASCRAKQEALYRTLHPNMPVPEDVRADITVELKRLTAITGSSAEVPGRISSLEVLRQVLANLPQPVRLRIVQMQIAPGRLVIEGQSRSHADAETIAQALKRAGLNMEPPRTETLSAGGVSFTLVGKPGIEAKPSGSGKEAKP